MKLNPTKLAGACIVEPEPIHDERGFFVRTFCAEQFAASGLVSEFPNCSSSFNLKAGTIRGLHYQSSPHEEAKLVRCIRGSIWDVIVDLRPGSNTFGQWIGVELTDSNRLGLYIPTGFAHGFQTLIDNCEVSYQISAAYVASASTGIRYDDPAIGITWPLPVSVVSERDLRLPLISTAFADAAVTK